MRKLLMIAAAIAVAAVAPPASASTPIEVVDEFTGAHCDLDTANCQAHMVSVGDVELEAHLIFHSHMLDCNSEFTLTMDEDGSGHITDIEFNSGGTEDPDCDQILSCHGGEWPFVSEESGPERTELLASVCFDLGTVICEGNVDMVVADNHDHTYEATTLDQRIGASICEMTGHWTSESANFEIVHL